MRSGLANEEDIDPKIGTMNCNDFGYCVLELIKEAIIISLNR